MVMMVVMMMVVMVVVGEAFVLYQRYGLDPNLHSYHQGDQVMLDSRWVGW